MADVGLKLLRTPTHSELVEFLSAARATDAFVTLYATCSVEYTGNREGTLGAGDRVILCKEDGAVAVHRPSGARAVARQGIGSSFEAVIRDDCVRMYAAKGQDESIRVDVFEASLAVRYDAVDEATLEENQTEEQMHAFINLNPEVIEDGLRILEHERVMPSGRVDFYAADEEGNVVILEIKQPVAKYAHVDQLRRYVSDVRESEASDVRGMLVAPKIGTQVKQLLRNHDLEWKTLDQFQTHVTSMGQTAIDEW